MHCEKQAAAAATPLRFFSRSKRDQISDLDSDASSLESEASLIKKKLKKLLKNGAKVEKN